MLVLTRHKGERIRVGSDITVELVELRGDKARIGITAPAHVPVDREEVFESKVADGLKSLPAVESAMRAALQELRDAANDISPYPFHLPLCRYTTLDGCTCGYAAAAERNMIALAAADRCLGVTP